MWELTQHRQPKGQQEQKVKIRLMEMAEYTFATYAAQLVDVIKSDLAEIPRTNNFSADLMFKAKEVDTKTVEVWKLKADGDDNYKIFTLKFIAS